MKRILPVFLIALIDIMGFGLLLPSMPYVVVNFGAPYWAATFIVSLYSLGQVISAPLWGRLSDRIGRRTVLIFTSIGFAACYGLVAVADVLHSLPLLIVARLGSGLMAGNISAAFAYVADVTTPENRAKGMGMIGAAFGLGFIFGPALGGILGGGSPETASLFGPSIAAMIASAVNLLLVYFLLPESLSAEHKAAVLAEGHVTRMEQFRRVARRPVLARMLIMVFLYQFAAGLFEMSVPYWTAAAFGWGPADVGKAMAAAGVAIVITQGGLMGPMVRKFGEAKLIAAAALVYGTLLLIQSRMSDAMVFIGFLCVMGMAQSFFSAPMTALVSKRAGATERGMVQGAQQSMVALARVVGPSLAGALYAIYAGLPHYAGAVLMGVVLLIYATIHVALHATEALPKEDGSLAGM